MKFKVMSFLRMLVICFWVNLGYTIEGLLIMLKTTYTFIKDESKVVCAPSKVESIFKTIKGEGSNLLTVSDCKKALEESSDFYVLVVFEVNNYCSDLLLIMKYFLDGFLDVIAEEILHRLPPMRDIQHYIDLILESVQPNKVAYRMNPKENEELQRKLMSL